MKSNSLELAPPISPTTAETNLAIAYWIAARLRQDFFRRGFILLSELDSLVERAALEILPQYGPEFDPAYDTGILDAAERFPAILRWLIDRQFLKPDFSGGNSNHFRYAVLADVLEIDSPTAATAAPSTKAKQKPKLAGDFKRPMDSNAEKVLHVLADNRGKKLLQKNILAQLQLKPYRFRLSRNTIGKAMKTLKANGFSLSEKGHRGDAISEKGIAYLASRRDEFQLGKDCANRGP